MDNVTISLNDLSALLHNPIAIRCATAEEAMELVTAFTKQFPDRISGVSVEDTYWDEYEEDTAYAAYDNDYERPMYLGYSEDYWWKDEGYHIIQFEELCPISEIDESDQPVEFLLSGVATSKVSGGGINGREDYSPGN